MALKVIAHMCNDDVNMDEFSLASFLSAAACLGTMETGKQIHCYSVKSGFEICNSFQIALFTCTLSVVACMMHTELLKI